MPHSFNILVDNCEQDQVLVNLQDLNPKLNNLNILSQTKGPPPLVDLLSLPKLLTRRTHHKVTSRLFQFICGHIKPIFCSLKQKAMDKKVVNKIRKLKIMDKEEKRSK